MYHKTVHIFGIKYVEKWTTTCVHRRLKNDKRFVETLFLCTRVKEHLDMIEKGPQTKVPVLTT